MTLHKGGAGGDKAMKWDTRLMAGRLASVAAIWGVSQALGTPAGKRFTLKIDQEAGKVKRKSSATVKQGKKNAKAHKAWLAAGIASLAVGTALIGRALKR
jgi:hypothetical protein